MNRFGDSFDVDGGHPLPGTGDLHAQRTAGDLYLVSPYQAEVYDPWGTWRSGGGLHGHSWGVDSAWGTWAPDPTDTRSPVQAEVSSTIPTNVAVCGQQLSAGQLLANLTGIHDAVQTVKGVPAGADWGLGIGHLHGGPPCSLIDIAEMFRRRSESRPVPTHEHESMSTVDALCHPDAGMDLEAVMGPGAASVVGNGSVVPPYGQPWNLQRRSEGGHG